MGAAPPIIFIHYGAASYLRIALKAARKANPSARIVLLGDKNNCDSARGVADFFAFEDCGQSDLVAEFDLSFRVIQGERHRFTKLGGVDAWLKFVFRRWFLVGEFLRREKIDSFWTFDSDTLILAELASRAARFAAFDATTQCKGACLNGWVGSADLVHRYNRFTVGLFQNTAYLEEQRKRLERHAGLAFNEMDAFSEFARREKLSTFHAQKTLEGEAFDDALAFVEGFEPSPTKVIGRTAAKRLWAGPGHGLYARRENGEIVRLLSCNMSWMPDFLWRRLMPFCAAGKTAAGRPPEQGELKEISYRRPPADIVLQRIRGVASKMRASFPSRPAGRTPSQ